MRVAVVILAAVLVGCGLAGCDRAATPSASSVKLGGPFALIDAEGRPVTDRSLLGKPTAIFFGFTYCPEVCPTTLAELTAALKALGPQGDALNVVFVSVDPARDTPAQMKAYLANFDPRIQGFTGSAAAVDAAVKAYRIYRKTVPIEGGGYTVDHSSAVYLFDKTGRFVEPIAYGAPHRRVVDRLRRLVS